MAGGREAATGKVVWQIKVDHEKLINFICWFRGFVKGQHVMNIPCVRRLCYSCRIGDDAQRERELEGFAAYRPD